MSRSISTLHLRKSSLFLRQPLLSSFPFLPLQLFSEFSSFAFGFWPIFLAFGNPAQRIHAVGNSPKKLNPNENRRVWKTREEQILFFVPAS